MKNYLFYFVPWSKFGKILPLTTPISNVLSDESSMGQSYYDLLGRRVQIPYNGIYIYNGKKVLLK